jgi:hypothetical protein
MTLAKVILYSGVKKVGFVMVTNFMANVTEAQNDLDRLLEAQ